MLIADVRGTKDLINFAPLMLWAAWDEPARSVGRFILFEEPARLVVTAAHGLLLITNESITLMTGDVTRYQRGLAWKRRESPVQWDPLPGPAPITSPPPHPTSTFERTNPLKFPLQPCQKNLALAEKMNDDYTTNSHSNHSFISLERLVGVKGLWLGKWYFLRGCAQIFDVFLGFKLRKSLQNLEYFYSPNIMFLTFLWFTMSASVAGHVSLLRRRSELVTQRDSRCAPSSSRNVTHVALRARSVFAVGVADVA